jgi:hypothetical protein
MKEKDKVKVETELEEILKESYKSIEDIFSSEDKGWINLSKLSQKAEFSVSQKRDIIKRSRFYGSIDPLTVQALRLWSDYSLGSGLILKVNNEKTTTKKILDNFWAARINKPVLSCKGQRQNSYKLLIDGSIYFALFLGTEGKVTIRRIDPLEITEIITNPDDLEDVRYYKRQWIDSQGRAKEGCYRSWQNIKDESTLDMYGQARTSDQEAIIYHIEREPDGLPLILPAMDWIKLFRQFLASRVAIILALARFAWKTKATGGSKAVAGIKAQVDQTKPDAGSWLIENMGSDTQPIKTDTGASGAYQDGRMLKLQICAAFGITEQYFGDISVGSLATAQTVELPMIKMFNSYQTLWLEAYKDISDIVLEHNNIAEADRIFDFDLPAITPEEASTIATNIAALIPAIPRLATSEDVLQQALMSIGVKDIAQAIEKLEGIEESNKTVALIKALQSFKETLK